MEYLNIFEKTVLYIESHLGDNISVDDVAKEVGYSYYHLTRLFQSLLGESVGNYIQKRRLSNSAELLLYSELKVIDIAMNHGFESPEGFSRAFKSVYGVSPAKYRQNRTHTFLGDKKGLNRELLQHLSINMTVQPNIKEIEEIKVIGISGQSNISELPKLWKQFQNLYNTIPNAHSSGRAFGICAPVQDVHTLSRDMVLHEVIGLEVTTIHDLPKHLVSITIPSGKYAVFTHRGSLKDIVKTYEYIWGTWLLYTKEILDDRCDFELYDERFLGADNKESEMEIYLPVK